MPQSVDLTFINDQNFFLAVDVTLLAAYYDLTVGTFRMQARPLAGAKILSYLWSSAAGDAAPGAIGFDAEANLLLITAPYADMVLLSAGIYVYGLQYELDNPTPRFVVEDLWTGSLVVEQGNVYT